MERVQRVISRVEPHDLAERYRELGVKGITGEAELVSPYEVEVGEHTLTTRSIILATGAVPFVSPIKGLRDCGFLTSDNLWSLRDLPGRLIVLGGGPIGCEMTQAFARLGAQVTQMEMLPRIMTREDADVSKLMTERFEKEGVRVPAGHAVQEARLDNDRKILVCTHGEKRVELEFDEILVVVGRRPYTRVLGLEDLEITLKKSGHLDTDPFLRTNYPNILCAGDVAGPYQFTHTAGHQAWYAALNALFGRFWKFRADYSVIPWCTFTDPEVARVGLNEAEAVEKGIADEVTRFDMAELDRAITEGETRGWVKVLTLPGKDKILGVTIVGSHAGELLAEYVLAMKHGIGPNKIFGTIHVYPTFAEANKMAAGLWKKTMFRRNCLRGWSAFTAGVVDSLKYGW
jgi:pyruvate/2-oxoglutarate dehydrogenase complex dihydrolipoamide dehydrogenase (E3) component